MRSVNLHTVKARVERLAAGCLDASGSEPLVFHWQMANTCGSCGFELLAYTVAGAHERALADGQSFIWADALEECPRCGEVCRQGDNPNDSAAERKGATDAR